MAVAGAILVLVSKVEDAVNIVAAVSDLLDDKIFRLHAVHPLRDVLHRVALHLAGGGVEQDDAVRLRQREAAQVVIGGDDPVGLSVVVQLKGVVGDAGQQSGAKAHLARHVKQQIAAGVVLDFAALDIAHVVGIGRGDDDVARRAFHIGEPLEKAGMVQRNHPHKLAVHHLNGGGLQFHLGAQRRAFAQFFLCQLQGQRLVHNRDLGDVDGLHLAVKCFDLRLAQLVAVGLPLEENRADNQHYGDDDPGNGDDDGRDLGKFCLGRVGKVVELDGKFADLQQSRRPHIGGDQHRPEECAIQIKRA